ncbi:carboxypeptidase-like regulatory domain-containing protein [Blastopirellula marina]|uniref:Carboxypeptidase regulatory-like domain-containing protein n=1 Tax=Blastopirellula marina DSM 3645 TaxID=314230 RepID=A3ZV18_9BACT|nr:carboxypeptidase-like regulatory domain-containing protein [Blastopirellula marina]EAQ79754.1 hypothetical protein DSM3645_24635 [Blastopirellula marina DSM 3645]
MRFISKQLAALAPLGVTFVLLVIAGCGGGRAGDVPDLGTVSGTVTLDGKPLADATVGFHSATAKRVSTGVTDNEGKYSMYLMNDIQGAPLGDNTVTISTAKMGDDAVPGSSKPETLPAKYNNKSTLTADVKAGDNTFDFPLQSK